MTEKRRHIRAWEFAYIVIVLAFFAVYFFGVGQRKEFLEGSISYWYDNLWKTIGGSGEYPAEDYQPHRESYNASIHGTVLLTRYQTGLSKQAGAKLTYVSYKRMLDLPDRAIKIPNDSISLFDVFRDGERWDSDGQVAPNMTNETLLDIEKHIEEMKIGEKVGLSLFVVPDATPLLRNRDALEYLKKIGFEISDTDHYRAHGKPAVFVIPWSDDGVYQKFWIAGNFIEIKF